MSKTRQRKQSAFHQGKLDAAQGLMTYNKRWRFYHQYLKGQRAYFLAQKKAQSTPIIESFDSL
jgi:hypothetical protein